MLLLASPLLLAVLSILLSADSATGLRGGKESVSQSNRDQGHHTDKDLLICRVVLFGVFGVKPLVHPPIVGTNIKDKDIYKNSSSSEQFDEYTSITEVSDSGFTSASISLGANDDLEIGCSPLQIHNNPKTPNDDRQTIQLTHDPIHELQLPKDFLEDHIHQILSGNFFVSIAGAVVSKETNSIVLADDAIITDLSSSLPLYKRPNQTEFLRHLSSSTTGSETMGQKRMLVVRISLLDATPTATSEMLWDLMFGSDRSVMMQFYRCSFGQLIWIPVGTRVYDVTVPYNVSQVASPSAVVNDALEIIQRQIGKTPLNQYTDNALFCLPNGMGGNPGSAGIGWWRAQFRNDWCDSLSAIMHETGHMLGLYHSNEYGLTYEDTTSYMGYGQKSATGPSKCYHGPANWNLGWYAKRSVRVELPLVSGAADGIYLATFVDYDLTKAEHSVLVNIADRYFLQYNRAKGMNVGTGKARNLVTVQEDLITSSELRAVLNVSDIFIHSNFSGSGLPLIVKVCERIDGDNYIVPDIMTVSIGINVTICDDLDAYMPSAAPSTRPSLMSPSPSPALHVSSSIPFQSPPSISVSPSRQNYDYKTNMSSFNATTKKAKVAESPSRNQSGLIPGY